jgi:hypothetical protein
MKFLQNAKKFGLGAALAGSAMSASAAIDVAGVNTAITTAETSAQTVGTTVIAVVAGLAVVGIVIALVRKL